MKTRSNMPLFVIETNDVKALSNSQIDLLRCGDYLVKKDASGEHAYKVTFKSATGMCITYHDAYCVETQSYDKVGDNWVYNSEDKTILNSLEQIYDKDGHKRFIEGDLITEEIENVEFPYGKFSLSGTHLLIVLVISAKVGATIANGQKLATIPLPEWVKEKIVPVWGDYIEINGTPLRSDAWASQNFSTSISIPGPNLIIQGNTAVTISDSDKKARYQFDLLIDNE